MEAETAGPAHTLVGALVRKKKREDRWVLAIRPLNEKSREICVRRLKGQPLPYDFLFLHCHVRVEFAVQESVQWAEKIELVQCAPNPTAIPLVLQGICDTRYPWTVIPALQQQPQKNDDEEEEEEEEDKKQNKDENNSDENPINMDPVEYARAILDMEHPSRPRRLAIARLVRGLESGPSAAVDRTPRTRPPFLRPKDHLVLQDLEHMRQGGKKDAYSWTWIQPIQLGNDDNENDHPPDPAKASSRPLNLPTPLEEQEQQDIMSFGKKHTRMEYMFEKKMPQVRRMVQRIRDLWNDSSPRHIVDIGGGRGDLATTLALEFPDCTVTVVDKNESSLVAGQEFAAGLGCAHHMNFVHGDMGQIVQALTPKSADNLPPNPFESPTFNGTTDLSPHVPEKDAPPIDLVVALHACGDLSDVALEFARLLQVPFVICPCCYTKRYIQHFTPGWNSYYCPEIDDPVTHNRDEAAMRDLYRSHLCRLAEIDENSESSHLARTAINSMRLYNMSQAGGYQSVSIEEYEQNSSRRNMVLVGSKT